MQKNGKIAKKPMRDALHKNKNDKN